MSLLRKILKPFYRFLRQGLSPKELSLTVLLGLIVGTMPLIGVNTALLAVIAIIFRLNMPLIQLANYAAFPLQLVMYIPFIKAGEFIFRQNLIPLSLDKIRLMFAEDWLLAIKKLWMAHLMGIFVWFIVWIPLAIILYYSISKIFQKIAATGKERNNKQNGIY